MGILIRYESSSFMGIREWIFVEEIKEDLGTYENL